MLKGLSTISLPTEALKITSADGKLLELTTCVLLFKIRIIEMDSKNGYLGRDATDESTAKIFVAELELYDKMGDGLIKSGEQHIQCNTNISEMSFPRQTMWNLKNFVKKSLSFSYDEISNGFLKPAKLKFDLQWSREIKSIKEGNKENGSRLARRVFTRSRSTGSITIRRSLGMAKSNDNIQCLVYQFIHKNYRQKTEIWGCLKCPWCTMKTTNLYILLKHLTLCHDRFKFKYVPGTNEIRIDVFVNKRADDWKIDPFSRSGTEFKGQEPHKRKILTNILVCRPERSRPKLAEFLVFDVNGIRRTFYHSTNGLPLKSNEIDIDSEDEIDPRWLRQNTIRMIDEFIDVNDGEKEIMKLWNLYILKHAIVCESQVSKAAISFIENYGEFILVNNLRRNCFIHLSNLFDYGLISDADFLKIVHKLHSHLLENKSLRTVLVQRHQDQMKYTLSKIKLNKTPKRPSNRIISTIKKRLRSHSRSESNQRNKIKRTDAMKNKRKPLSTPVHRAARKTAKITK